MQEGCTCLSPPSGWRLVPYTHDDGGPVNGAKQMCCILAPLSPPSRASRTSLPLPGNLPPPRLAGRQNRVPEEMGAPGYASPTHSSSNESPGAEELLVSPGHPCALCPRLWLGHAAAQLRKHLVNYLGFSRQELSNLLLIYIP